MKRFVELVVVVAAAGALGVLGCGGAVIDFPASDDADGGAGGDAARGDAGGGGGGGGGGGAGRDGAAGDASRSDAATPTCAQAGSHDQPATVTVHVTVTNGANADRWVTVGGTFSANPCTPFGLRVASTQASIPLAAAFQCGCECPNPGAPAFDVRRLEPGASFSFSWDGRTVDATTCTLACGPETSSTEVYAYRPTSPGKYEMLVSVDTGAPVGCTSTGDPDVYACGGGSSGSAGSFGLYAPMCSASPPSPSAAIVATPFALPSSGAVDVNVTL